jgi:hypothetical protein
MKKTLAMVWAAALLTGLFVAGCTKDQGPDEQAPSGVGSNEQSAMKYYAANDDFVGNDEATFADKDVEPADYGTFGKIDAAIIPLRFGRFIDSVSTNVTVEVQPGDSLAIAHIAKAITGTFKIKAINGTGDTVLIQKRFVDNSNRNVIFKRIGREVRRFWVNWIPVATSLVAGATAQTATPIAVTKLELLLANGDTITVTDPTSYYLRYRWRPLFGGGRKDVPELLGGQRLVLQATVLSPSADTDFVALRFGANALQRKRQRMTLVSQVNNPNGTYTRVFQIAFFMHFHPGFFNAGVDAMTRATIYDDVAPYSVSWWGIPYRVF